MRIQTFIPKDQSPVKRPKVDSVMGQAKHKMNSECLPLCQNVRDCSKIDDNTSKGDRDSLTELQLVKS